MADELERARNRLRQRTRDEAVALRLAEKARSRARREEEQQSERALARIRPQLVALQNAFREEQVDQRVWAIAAAAARRVTSNVRRHGRIFFHLTRGITFGYEGGFAIDPSNEVDHRTKQWAVDETGTVVAIVSYMQVSFSGVTRRDRDDEWGVRFAFVVERERVLLDTAGGVENIDKDLDGRYLDVLAERTLEMIDGREYEYYVDRSPREPRDAY